MNQLAQEFTLLENQVLTLVGELPYPPVTLAAQSYLRNAISLMFNDLREWSEGRSGSFDVQAEGMTYIVGKALDRWGLDR